MKRTICPSRLGLLFALGATLLGSTALAAREGEPIQVTPLDPNVDLSALKKDYHVQALPRPPKGELPTQTERDATFKKAQLLEATATMDALARDLLYGDARTLPLDELIKAYPKLPRKNLEDLKKLVSR